MSVGGRPLLYPVKKLVGLDYSIISKIDAWRRDQGPIPNMNAAIRALLTIGASAATNERIRQCEGENRPQGI
jgi:hypothetical protein